MTILSATVLSEINERFSSGNPEDVAHASCVLFSLKNTPEGARRIEEHKDVLFSPIKNPDFSRWWKASAPQETLFVCKVIEKNASLPWSNSLFQSIEPAIRSLVKEYASDVFYRYPFCVESTPELFYSVLTLPNPKYSDLVCFAARQKMNNKLERVPQDVWQKIWDQKNLDVLYALPDQAFKQVIKDLKINNIRSHFHMIFLHGPKNPSKMKLLFQVCKDHHRLSIQDCFYYVRRWSTIDPIRSLALHVVLDMADAKDAQEIASFYQRKTLLPKVLPPLDKECYDHPKIQKAMMLQDIDFKDNVSSPSLKNRKL